MNEYINNSFIFVHSFIHSFIQSFTHSFIQSINHDVETMTMISGFLFWKMPGMSSTLFV